MTDHPEMVNGEWPEDHPYARLQVKPVKQVDVGHNLTLIRDTRGRLWVLHEAMGVTSYTDIGEAVDERVEVLTSALKEVMA